MVGVRISDGWTGWMDGYSPGTPHFPFYTEKLQVGLEQKGEAAQDSYNSVAFIRKIHY